MKKRLKKWKVVRSFYVKKTPWVNWRVDACRLPGDHRVDEYHITEIPSGVGVVALTEKKEVILVRQYRHGTRKILLEVPGGMVSSRDRTPLQAARRELREETGYSSQNWILLSELFLHPPSQNNFVYIYLALNARRSFRQRLDRAEQIEVVVFPFERVLHMIRRRRLQSLGSTAAILLARDKIRL